MLILVKLDYFHSNNKHRKVCWDYQCYVFNKENRSKNESQTLIFDCTAAEFICFQYRLFKFHLNVHFRGCQLTLIDRTKKHIPPGI